MELEEIMQEPWLPSQEVIDKMRAISEPVKFKKGDKLVEQDKRSHHFFIIEEGLCRSFYSDENYEDTNLFGKDGDIVGSVGAYFRNVPARFSIEALTPLITLRIPFIKLREAMSDNDELSRWVRDLLFGQIDALEKRYSYRSSRNDAYFRYVAMVDKWPHNRFCDIPLKHIAQYLQIAPQTLSKIRRRYLKNG